MSCNSSNGYGSLSVLTSTSSLAPTVLDTHACAAVRACAPWPRIYDSRCQRSTKLWKCPFAEADALQIIPEPSGRNAGCWSNIGHVISPRDTPSEAANRLTVLCGEPGTNCLDSRRIMLPVVHPITLGLYSHRPLRCRPEYAIPRRCHLRHQCHRHPHHSQARDVADPITTIEQYLQDDPNRGKR